MEALRTFMKSIAVIKPPYGDLMRNGIPGQGVANPAADQTNVLYRTAHAFATAYQRPDADPEELKILASDAEASLMAVATMGVITQDLCDELVDMLRALVRAKSS